MPVQARRMANLKISPSIANSAVRSISGGSYALVDALLLMEMLPALKARTPGPPNRKKKAQLPATICLTNNGAGSSL
jgi:hypothetical protein